MPRIPQLRYENATGVVLNQHFQYDKQRGHFLPHDVSYDSIMQQLTRKASQHQH